MKPLLALLLLISCEASGQKKDTAAPLLYIDSVYSAIGIRSGQSYVGQDNNGRYLVEGDSLTAIRLLWERYRDVQKKNDELQIALIKSAQFRVNKAHVQHEFAKAEECRVLQWRFTCVRPGCRAKLIQELDGRSRVILPGHIEYKCPEPFPKQK